MWSGTSGVQRRDRLASLLVLIALLLSGIPAGLSPATAQETDNPQGSDPTRGRVRVTSRESGTNTLLTGGCYFLAHGSQSSGGCDVFDGLDGVTTFESPPGTFPLYTALAPSHHYIISVDSVEVITGETTTATIRHPSGGADLTIKTYGPTGSRIPGACFSVFESDNGRPGPPKSNVSCDAYDGRLDGIAPMYGISHLPNPSILVVMTFVPPGYRAPASEPVTIGERTEHNVYFHLRTQSLSPACTIGPTSGKVGTTIKVNCKGFPAFQAVTVKWDGRSSVSVAAFSNEDGRFTAFLTVPAATAGAHRVVVASDTHRAPTKVFTVLSSLSVSPESGPGGSTARATIRGFASGETVTIRVQGRRTVLATITASATGSGSALFTIPDGDAASLIVRADGNAGNAATDGFQRTGPSPEREQESHEPTETPLPTATPSNTPQPEATATETATAEATATPSEVLPTLTPSPDATASPTEALEATPSPPQASPDSPSVTPSPTGTG